MSFSGPPPSSFLPRCPVELPEHEPRPAADGSWRFLSDLQPDNGESSSPHDLCPYPHGKLKKRKWLTLDEIRADLISQGYDTDLADETINIFRPHDYYMLHPYYMHKKQAKRNKKRAAARALAESLVGTQTPPAQEEG